MVSIPKTQSGIEKLAKRVSQFKRKKLYKQGSGEEKTWINFQVTKQLKRDFVQVCNTYPKTNASEYIRQCMEALIKMKSVSLDIPYNVKPEDEIT